MMVTIPLGREVRFSFGHSSQSGWFTMRWRKPRAQLWYPRPDGEDDDGLTGVREPRKPSPSSLAGQVLLPRPIDDDFH
jgi:hypothetical protein